MTELSVIIPCRNNAAVLGSTLDGLHSVVSHHSISAETLIVDDGSKDETIRVAMDAAHRLPALHIRILQRKHLQQGLGGTLRYGMAFALSRYCVLISPSGEDPVELLPTFLFHLRAGAQLVQCSRPGNPPGSFTHRRFRSLYRFAASQLLGFKALDTTYAFRAFDRIFIQALGLTARYYNVCPEMTFKVLLCGGKVQYVPSKLGMEEAHSLYHPPLEFWGYTAVLLRGLLHRLGVWHWF